MSLDRLPSLSRRGFLGLGAGAAAVLAVGNAPSAYADPLKQELFTLGVASGDPRPDSVVLWTRLAAAPLALDGLGGMPDRKIPVHWQVAEDERFARVVRQGTELATRDWAHSVHAEVTGLRPDREYFYRFRVQGQQFSPIGRTRTAPAEGADNSAFTFGFTSCSNLPAGYFTAYRHMAEDNLALIVHLGDYLYEGEGRSALPGRSHSSGAEMFTLGDYRARYSQYKTDPDLQAAHAAAAWVHVNDDHEVENNWAGDYSQPDTEPDQDPDVFRQRRAAAYKAMYENLPYRPSSTPQGPDMQVYRQLRFGRLLDLDMLDTRQFRSRQLQGCVGDCTARWDDSRTMLGSRQHEWLLDKLGTSQAQWKVLGNQLITFDADSVAGPGQDFSEDNWNGYAAARQSLYQGIVDRGVDNLVIVTGDAHRNAASDLKLKFYEESSPTIGAEFLGTSISSGGDGSDSDARGRLWLAENPHIKFANAQRGYQRVRVSKEQLLVDYRVVDYVTRPGAPIRDRATLTVRDGRPGIADVAG